MSKRANNIETSLAFDPGGNPSIAFVTTEKGGAALKFARRNGSSWDIQTVDAAAAQYKQLVYDPSGNPSIAYCDDINGDNWIDTLKFARWNGASWDVQIVQTGTIGYGVNTALAYDPGGNPSLVDCGTGMARFLHWNGSGWDIENVAPGAWCRIMYDGNGVANISIMDGSKGMVLATRNGSGWETEVVDSTGLTGGDHSLKPDANGNPTLSWGGFANGQAGVFYVRKGQ